MPEMLLVPGAGEHFHPNGIAGGDLDRQQVVYLLADRRTGVAEKFDPSGGVDERHEFRYPRISPRSPTQPLPRILRASSSSSGSAASVRNAKLIASRFVAKQYRRMTMEQASSSISTFVRDIHQRYAKPPQASKLGRLFGRSAPSTGRVTRRDLCRGAAAAALAEFPPRTGAVPPAVNPYCADDVL